MGSMGELHGQAPFMYWVLVARYKQKGYLASAPFDYLFTHSSSFFPVEELAENLREMMLFWSVTGRAQTRKEGHSRFTVQCSFCFLLLSHREEHFRKAPPSLQILLAREHFEETLASGMTGFQVIWGNSSAYKALCWVCCLTTRT